MSTDGTTTAGDVSAGLPREGHDRAWALALAAIVGAEFMLQLDGTIVNVALPALQSDLGLSVAGGSWVPNGFLLAFGGLLLFAGRLGDALGHRRVFLAGLGLIVVASLVAGLAPNAAVLIAGRVLQGAGAAVAGPTGLALLAIVFRGELQQRAFGLYSTVTGLGASAGMVLGGVLTWAGDWRWSLLVNVPIGLVVAALAARALGVRDEATRSRSLGLPRVPGMRSALLSTATLAAAVYGLVHAAEKGWGDRWTPTALGAAVVLAAVLLLVDRRAAEPLLPLAVLAGRERAGAFAGLLLLAAVLTGFLIYLVQYLQGVLHLDALRSGLAILPFGLALLVSTQILTARIAAVGLRTRALLGLAVVLAGAAWLTRLDGGSAYAADVLPALVVMGLGVGVAIIPLNMIVLTTVPAEYAGVAAGLLQTALTIGGSLGLAAMLIPLGANGLAEGISSVFAWACGALVAALLVVAASWYRPGVRG
ncbi:MFS transporter [Microbispora catharanthi]|uniref:MFS transporter n=1 Tax=Microbispora catharanthi TaxID=1712871 RepID=A0A5N6BIU4_9ACTN|nr:MFS transporter [Microbispora catharanthi]KAB8180372.1 MFS transporter [Microbispora catharanthi]